MPQELKIPEIGESIHEVEIGEWLKQEGDSVEADEPIVVLESEKSTLDLPSPAAGKLSKILKKQGETAEVGEVIGELEDVSGEAGEAAAEGEEEEEGKPAKKAKKKKEEEEEEKKENEKARGKKEDGKGKKKKDEEEDEEEIEDPRSREEREEETKQDKKKKKKKKKRKKKREEEEAKRKKKREEDREDEGDERQAAEAEPEDEDEETKRAEEEADEKAESEDADEGEEEGRRTETVPMTPIRRTIARRLQEGTREAVLLTTFNEIDMLEVSRLRDEQGAAFHERHGVKLGLLPFFVKAVVEALEAFPEINAKIDGEDIVYHEYCDVGIAVAGGEGLVVPVIRDAQDKDFAQVENEIEAFARRAESGDLEPSELRGGTFTITNGGVFGSLMSTPVINPPQSAILGLHAIHDRPVARDGEVVIRPMMYVALSYDHRIVDGREAVQFLARVRDLVESPARMILGL